MSKKKKVRVAFRKNRDKGPASSDVSRQIQQDEELVADLPVSERVSGKGSLSRYRTIISSTEDDAGEHLREIDLGATIAGRVVGMHGFNYCVRAEDGREYDCVVRRVVKTLARDERSAVVVGDRVRISEAGSDSGVIERVEPRHGILARNTRRGEHLLVTNVDQVLIVVAAADPPFKPNLIDRYLISAELGGLKPVICINKIDMVNPRALLPVVGTYGQLGYEAVLVSVTKGWGLDRLRQLLRGRQTVVSGQSGVGKSSLLNGIQPGLKLSVSTICDETRKGRHTTTSAILLPLEVGGWVVDTPGIRSFELANIDTQTAAGHFREFRPYLANCKFANCSHTHETGCAVKNAVDRDLVSLTRYESYLKLIHGLES